MSRPRLKHSAPEHSPTPARVVVLAGLAVAAGIYARAQDGPPTTLTQVMDRPSTVSLEATSQFFTTESESFVTTLPVTSTVVGEAPTTIGALAATPPDEGEGTQPLPATGPVPGLPADPTEADLAVREEAVTQGLPVKVDDSSSAAQVMQLAEFEKRNQIGEAFLLAVELVKQNPSDEVAYDAVIRNSLILGRNDDIERYYREAIKNSSLPGKYYVQLAHYYQRTGKMTELQKLITDYAESNNTAPDYRITLARLFSVAGDSEALTALFDRQGIRGEDIFPFIHAQIKAYADVGREDRVTSIAISTLDNDFDMTQQRVLLQEILRLKNPPPDLVIALTRSSLVNETDYQAARKVADNVIQQAQKGRYFTFLNDHLTSEGASRRLMDTERWLLSLFYRAGGQEREALEVLMAESAGNTPVIAFERAQSLTDAGRAEEAIPTLATLLAEQPDNLDIRFLLAEQLAQLRQTTHTLQLMGSLRFADLTSEQQSRYATLTISSLMANQEPERLLESWQDMAVQAPFNVLQAMGDTVVRSATDTIFRDQLAQAALDRIENRADAWPLYLLLARLSASEKEPLTELEYYERYLEHDRDNVQMLRFVAELALLHGNVPISLAGDGENGPSRPIPLRASHSEATANAVELYRRLIDLQPSLPENYAALMRAYQLRGEVDTARRVALEYADRASSTPESIATAARMLVTNGFPEDALPLYRASVLQQPLGFETWLEYARTLRSTGKYQPASDILKKMLEEGLHGIPFNQPEIFSNLLTIAQDTNTTESLVEYLDSLREKQIPGMPEFCISSAKLLTQIGRPDLAREFLNDLAENHKDSRFAPDGLLLLGQLDYTDGRPEEAIETFTRVKDDFSTSPAAITAIFNIAEIQRQQGQVESALQTWLKLAEAHPDNDKALEAIYVASLSAWNDLERQPLAIEIMEQYVISSTQDYAMLRHARKALQNMRAGQPPLHDNAPPGN